MATASLSFKPKATVKRLLSSLPDRARDVLVYRYGLSADIKRMTLDAIGKKYGITRERVRQIENYGIANIRKSAEYKQEKAVFTEIEALLHSLGGIVVEEDFLGHISKDKALQNHIHFLHVVGEPFRMWVIEDTHHCAMPAWAAVGAIVVDDVRPYEILKMRVLNGIQSNVCQLGLLSDLLFMADVMGEETFETYARRTIVDEVVPGLPAVSGIDVAAYVEQSIRRLKNPDLRHGTLQISTDGSQKIRQRLLEPLRAAIVAGRPANGLLLGVAGWMCYASSLHWRNAPIDVRDPKSATTTEIGQRLGHNPQAFVQEMLGLADVFGTDLIANAAVRTALARFVGRLRSAPAIEVVAALLRGD